MAVELKKLSQLGTSSFRSNAEHTISREGGEQRDLKEGWEECVCVCVHWIGKFYLENRNNLQAKNLDSF